LSTRRTKYPNITLAAYTCAPPRPLARLAHQQQFVRIQALARTGERGAAHGAYPVLRTTVRASPSEARKHSIAVSAAACSRHPSSPVSGQTPAARPAGGRPGRGRACAACRRDILTMALENATLAGPMIVRTCSFTRSSACRPHARGRSGGSTPAPAAAPPRPGRRDASARPLVAGCWGMCARCQCAHPSQACPCTAPGRKRRTERALAARSFAKHTKPGFMRMHF